MVGRQVLGRHRVFARFRQPAPVSEGGVVEEPPPLDLLWGPKGPGGRQPVGVKRSERLRT